MSQTTAWWREPTREQWVAFGAVSLGWVLDAFDFTIFLIVMPEIARSFGVGLTATSVSITLTLLVRLLGGLTAGWAADRYGRRLPLMLSIVWFALCDGAVAFAPSFTWVLVLRTLFGFGMGAEWTAGSALVMESWPARSRGIASGLLQGSWAIGYLLAGVVAGWVVPSLGWRALFLMAAAPALLALPIRWLVKEPAREVTERRAPPRWRELLEPRIAKRLVWASAMLGAGFGAYYGLTALYATLLKTELAFTSAEVAGLVAYFNVGMMLGALGWGALASRRGPIFAIAVPVVLTLFVLPLYVGLLGFHGPTAPLAGSAPLSLAVGALLGGAFGAGHSGVTPYLLHGLFPTPVRARAMGLVYHAGAFAAALVPTVAAALSGRLGIAGSMAIIVGAFNLVLLVVLATARRMVSPASPSSPAPPH